MALAFARNRSSKDGLRGECRDCTSDKNEVYRARVRSQEAEDLGLPDYVYAQNLTKTVGKWGSLHKFKDPKDTTSQGIDTHEEC